MFPYIYTERNNIHILDLVQSAQLLKEANSYLQSAAEQKKTFCIDWNKTPSKCINCTRSKTL